VHGITVFNHEVGHLPRLPGVVNILQEVGTSNHLVNSTDSLFSFHAPLTGDGELRVGTWALKIIACLALRLAHEKLEQHNSHPTQPLMSRTISRLPKYLCILPHCGIW